MSRALLVKYMAGRDEVPPLIVLRTVDILLEQRESQLDHSMESRGGSDAEPRDLPA